MFGTENCQSWLDLLALRAVTQGDKVALAHVTAIEAEPITITYAELQQRARAVGEWLKKENMLGQRIVIALPSSIDYIVVFFGCQYAQCIPVPVYPPNPKNKNNMSRFQAVLIDAEPAMIFCQAKDADVLQALRNENDGRLFRIQDIEEVATDSKTHDPAPALQGDDIAFLQYTSGSTSSPKGVMVSHLNLMHNSQMLAQCLGFSETSIVASWLPMYHDMGLIGTILCNLYAGTTCYFILPASFIQKPFLWLKMISDYRCTISGAPNFAYDLCCNRITAEEKATLDLSCWCTASNGSEATSAATVRRFAEEFSVCGFRYDAISPCYGLAEATLMVTGKLTKLTPVVKVFQRQALRQGKAVESTLQDGDGDPYLCHGNIVLADQRLEIVDPHTHQLCREGEVGEIWTSGGSIAMGYWNRDEESKRVFAASLANGDATPFLRTGDLGFIYDGGLYISGRIKDIFIVNGQNVYPQDVERVINDHFSKVVDSCAVVSAQEQVEMADVLIEVKRVRRRSLDFAATAQAISGKVALEFGLPLASVTFLQSGYILRTTSGKIQRSANRAALAAGELVMMHRWLRQPDASVDKPATSIREQVVSLAAKVLQVQPESINSNDEVGILGFTSLSFAEFSAHLNVYFGIELTAAAMFEYATLQELIDHVQALSCAATAEAVTVQTPMAELTLDVQQSASEIAIIGVGGRMPGCGNLAEFAEKLLADADLLGPVPEQRWSHEDWPAAQKRGGFLRDVAGFDAAFFKMTPHEAQFMDPQQRLFLEAAWGAIEDAGYRASDFAGRPVGVFVGVSTNDYKSVLRDAGQLAQDVSITGAANSNIANRVSYFFNFSGPSEVIDTACSSSLCAVHRAVDALKNGDCELALVGGVSALLHAEIYQSLAEAGMLSPDERCMSFDERANGYVRGEGVAAILLQPLAAAKMMRANIRALVLGSAVNHGGKVNTLTTPNPNAQAELLRQAYARAAVEPQHIGYIETHGTGTNLGDPIEINGLKKAFAAMLGNASVGSQTKAFCGLGSVKANIGHLEAAAGIAGVLKVLIAMQHQRLPGMPHFQQLNSQIQLQDSPFYIVDKCRPWPAPRNAQGEPAARVAGVSSFGFGGSNAHVVLQEYVAAVPSVEDGSAQLFIFSTDSENGLQELLQAMRNAIRQQAPALADIAYTLALGREVFSHRLAVCAHSRAHLLELLDAWLSGERSAWHQGMVKRNAGAASLSPALQAAMARKDWPALAAAWVEGIELPWLELLDGQRISLPGYPFARKPYWVQPARTLPETAAAQCLTVRSYWQTEACISAEGEDNSTLTILLPMVMANRLQPLAGLVGARWLTLPSATDSSIAAAVHSHCAFLLNELQTLLRDIRQQRILLLLPDDCEVYFRYAPLVSMLQTANLEAPHLQSKVLRVAPELPELTGFLQQEAAAQFGAAVQVRIDTNGQRTVLHVEEFNLPQLAGPGRLKENGCYWITGGLGGLGQQLAHWLCRQPGRRVILSGRAAADQRTRQLMQAFGAQVHYLQADLADADSVAESLRQIKVLAGKVDGIFHTAGLLRDGLLRNKTVDDLQQVLQPKVDAVLALATAISDAPPDFVLLFSSLAALRGNPGQADYAAANAFMDAFASDQQRHGVHWLSIAWPFWREGGMQLDADMLDVLYRQKGLRPMPVECGLTVLEQALASPLRQFATLYGEREFMLRAFVEKVMPVSAGPLPVADFGQSQLLKASVVCALKKLFQEITSIPQQDVDETLPLEDFGLNSVMVVRFNSRFEEVFGKLSHTLLYEYQTIDALADYLVQAHTPACVRWTRAQVSTSSVPVGEVVSAVRQTGLHTALPVTENMTCEPIAIIGMAGRYPQARNLEQFWQNLLAGRDSISEIPRERWPLEGFYLPDRTEAVEQGKSYSKWGGFIDGYDEFDSLFFNISPKEARGIDPQERLFLECCWSCIEDAGHTRDSLHAYRVGVFAGVTKTGFELHGTGLPSGDGIYPLTSFGSLANRVSYFFNFQGPSMPIDTMCSSSLTAIHEACQHIRRGECEVALAGGVNLYTHPLSYVRLSAKQFLADDGCCRSFGNNGTGFVPGEGVGAVLLKSLRQAEIDGDQIHGLILGSAINHGGKTNGYTTPNPVAQGDLIRSALQRAGVKVEQVSYIEAHGTGTALGDPIEINGLSRAFVPDTPLKQFCRIGSVKSNIGHGEAAAGIAGVSKILLQMKHETLVPSLHAEELNQNIDFANSPFVVQRDQAPWLREQANGETRPRIAGISSFGAGGSNAHLVMQDYPEKRASAPSGTQAYIVPFSARNEAALKAMLRSITDFLSTCPPENLALQDIAFTLQTGREAMEMRAVFLVVTLDELQTGIASFLRGETDPARFLSGRVRKSVKNTVLENATPHEVASAWAAGEVVEWTRLYRHGLPRRISLPGYVFSAEVLPVVFGKPRFAHDDQAQLKQRIGPLLTQLHPRATLEAAALVYEGSIRCTMPLLDQHRVYGQPIFPGSGTIEIMLEAVQHAFPTQQLHLGNLFWVQPLHADGEERRVHAQIVRDGEHYLIRVCSADIEVQSVYAQAQFEMTTDPEPENAAQLIQPHLPELWSDASDKQRFYEKYHSNGVAYGAYFRAIKRIWAGADEVLAYLELDEQFQHELDDYVLHPVLLDNALQCVGLIVGADQQKIYLPSAMAALTQYAALQRGMYVVLKKRGELRFDLKLIAPDGRVCVVCDDFRVRHPMQDPLDRLVSKAEPATLQQYGFDSAQHLQQLPPSARLPLPGPLAQREAKMAAVVEFNRGNAAVDTFCHAALLNMLSQWGWREEQEVQSLPQLLQRFGVIDKYQRLFEVILQMLLDVGTAQRTHQGYLRSGPAKPFAIEQAVQNLLLSYPEFSAHISLLQDCLVALPEVLRGNTLATDVIFPDSSLHKVTSLYHDNPVVEYFNQRVADCVVARIEQLAKNLSVGEKIRILEVGAGTGGTSAMLFRELQPYAHLVEYVYSDVSKSFLIYAQQKFGASAPFMRTCIINVEQPVTEQNINIASFDIMLGTNVLHAVKNIATTLINLKPALKNGGLFLINEMAKVQCFSTLTFGLLDGWWKYEDEEIRMPGSPGLAPQQWQRLLAEAGFISTQLIDGNTADLGQQVYMTESNGLIFQASNPVTANKNHADSAHIPSHVQVQHAAASVTQMTEIEQTAKLQQTLITAVAQSLQLAADQVEPDRPLSELGVDSIIGVSLVQTINKALGLTLQTTVLFDYPTVQALQQHIQASYAADLIKHQAAQSMLTTAVVPSASLAPQPEGASSTSCTLEADGYYKLIVHGPGTIDDLQWLPQQALSAPGPTQVVIENHAFSLNFGDLLCIKGIYPSMPPYPFTPGFEASGVVRQVGSEVHAVQPGDEVIVLGGVELGCQANLLLAESGMLLRKPAGLDHEQACTLPTVLLTVVEVFRRVQLRQGETILIQTAAGGIGLIAVQYALSKGANIIATCGSEHKRQYLLGLGVTYVINYVEQDFAQEVQRLTAGAGVDIVLNTLAGDAMQKGLDCLARRGRYVEIAMTALKSARSIDLSGLSNNQSYYGIDLRKLGLEDHAYVMNLWDEALEWIAAGVIKPTISQVFPQEHIHAAYRHLEQRMNIGKVVVSLAPAKIHADSVMKNTGKAQQRERDNAIAIIGMSGAFAEADRLDQFWAALADGKNLVREVPSERWSSADYYDPQAGKDGKTNCKWGGFLNGIDCFDPMFFRISALEAENMDPQQRLFLQHAWNAIEDAAIVPSSLAGSACGVFVAAASSDYPSVQQQGRDACSFWGHANSVIGARVAYFLDLNGPAITVDTACSSSLVAVHLACQSLLSGETDSVLTGGVFLQTTPEFYLYAARAGMLSPDGCCYTFDGRANGFVPGEGVGVLLLKRLADAQRDGDPIHGVIRASSVNQDGRTNGLTAPSGLSQQRLLTKLLLANGIHPEQIQYCEAHGTGTPLGDPIEFNALCESFSGMTDKKRFCALGSVKTNIGHIASAAGVAGIIKVLLSMRHGVIPASLNFESANPELNLDASPFYIPTAAHPWPPGSDGIRRALVSSFGFGGTNGMLCLEQHPAPSQFEDRLTVQQQIVPLSAKTAFALRQRVLDLLQHLQASPDIALADCAMSLQQGREQMAVKVSFVASTMAELRQQLEQFLAQTTEHPELEALSQWQAQGVPANYGRRIHLPGYRFSQERYWPRPVTAAPCPATISTDEIGTSQTSFFYRTWQAAPLPSANTHPERRPDMAEGRPAQIIMVDWSQSCAREIQFRLRCELKLTRRDTNQDAASVAVQAFQLLLRHLQTLPATAQQLLLVLPDSEDSHLYAPLVSLWQTALREQAEWQGRVIWLQPATPVATILHRLQEELHYVSRAQIVIRYLTDGSRQTCEIQALPDAPALLSESLVTAGKVVWICGGQGGIGQHIAHHLAPQPGIKLILSGRSACNTELLQALRLQLRNGGEVDYLQLDIGDLAETQQAADMIRQRFGALHGVLHCAGVIQDALLRNKNAAQVDSVFRPKVAGTIALDQATANDKLDFFLLFASISGVSGSPGQADYAAANAFQDAFACYRARLQTVGLRSGLSMAVDWCAWQDGGMQQGSARQHQLQEQFGLLALSTSQGCAVLDLLCAAAAHTHALIVLQHRGARHRNLFRIEDDALLPPAIQPATPVNRSCDPVDVRQQVLEIFEEITRTPASRLDGNATYHEFGIDSLLAIKLTKRLAECFGPLPDTLLYEHLNINQLCTYLAAQTSCKH